MAEYVKEQIELKDDEMGNVSGGVDVYDPGIFWQYRFRLDETEIDHLEGYGITGLEAGRVYFREELEQKLGVSGSDAIKWFFQQHHLLIKEVDNL